MDHDSVVAKEGYLATYNPTKLLTIEDVKAYATSLRVEVKNANTLLCFFNKKYKPDDIIVTATKLYIQRIKNTQYALARRGL